MDNYQEKESAPRIIRLDEIGSTNGYLREHLRKEKLPEGSVVMAGFQTAGRGQQGNTWEAGPGKNLLFSVVLYPDCIPANRQFLISQIAALSVKEALERRTDGITVKWPNDIYWKDKKICGMLVENDLMGATLFRSIIGIGINVNQTAFTPHAPNAVSLVQITGKTHDREEILDAFLSRFYGYYLRLLQEKEEEIREAYRQVLYRKNGYHPYSDADGPFTARIRDIEPTGHLLLQLKSGEVRRYAFKEVIYR
ncbi:MAG: biotin--[acetyl-CoA-carboxylase] ligase [Tannerellaceae bacterium]|jgi:BirA family biotin operon repressor/biotin-[acetyl-CoA-carboxylase] ligase|nr:biotin--[acetyl-CoA-carboxylase] ligase [Tannerellaceae bacterium]